MNYQDIIFDNMKVGKKEKPSFSVKDKKTQINIDDFLKSFDEFTKKKQKKGGDYEIMEMVEEPITDDIEIPEPKIGSDEIIEVIEMKTEPDEVSEQIDIFEVVEEEPIKQGKKEKGKKMSNLEAILLALKK